VAVGEALAIVLALSTLAMLPCLVVIVLFADAFINSVRVQRQRIYRLNRRAAARLDQPEAEPEVEPVPEAAGPPLEQIAAEIHRLTYARRTAAPGTPRFVAATRAYDRRLSHACRALEIDEHLDELIDVDLELERVRVEGELLGAGFVLDSDYSRPA
jgi:hypothetical protein